MSTRSSAILIEEVLSSERFREIEPAWQSLHDASDESFPMQGHAWLLSWWQAFGAGEDCRIVLAWDSGTLVGAAPLVVRFSPYLGFRRRVVSLFANTWVDRMHLLLAQPSPAIVDAILDHLHANIGFDLLDLYPLDDASPQTTLLLDAIRRRGWPVGSEMHLQSPCMPMPDSWTQLLESLSPSFRQSVRRKLRKIESMPGVTMRVVRDASCIDAIMAVSVESWQQDVRTSMASTAQIRNFYIPIIEAAARDGSLRCAVMEIDGQPVAFEFNLRHRTTLHNFKLGFDKKFGELSTGIVLKAHVLQESLGSDRERGLLEYDFMGTSEPYKLNWTKAVRSHSRHYVFAPRVPMRLAYWVMFTLKPWVRSSMPWLVRASHRMKRMIWIAQAREEND